MMRLLNNLFFVTLLIVNVKSTKFYKQFPNSHLYSVFPCADSTEITSQFSDGLTNGYNLIINKELETGTNLKLKFDSEAAVTFDRDFGRLNTWDNIKNIFDIILFKSNDTFVINVRGHPTPYPPPYLTSIKINDYEFCHQPNLTYFEDFPVAIIKRPDVPDRFCGRRKVLHKEWLLHGVTTKPGDWPWHTAVYHRENVRSSYVPYRSSYKCGGTLISNYFVLTSAHCTTRRGVPILPEIFSVFLGKYNLYEDYVALQEKEVFKVYIHEEFAYRTLDHDISLLKLRTEAVYNNYVQPACLWDDNVYNRLPSSEIQGAVAGWGFHESDNLDPTLHAVKMPMVPDWTCKLTNPLFYVNALKISKKFCAGYTNGTSICRGYGGGSFSVFVPDVAKSNSTEVPGAWYVRGIVSTGFLSSNLKICNLDAYVVFTDVEKYLDWIKSYVEV